jgi:hypothetical protein
MFNEIQQASFKTISELNNLLQNACAVDEIASYTVMSIQATRTEVRSYSILSHCTSYPFAARFLAPLPHK